jgi:hypothetical protein
MLTGNGSRKLCVNGDKFSFGAVRLTSIEVASP